jgi:hypothetical protein
MTIASHSYIYINVARVQAARLAGRQAGHPRVAAIDTLCVARKLFQRSTFRGAGEMLRAAVLTVLLTALLRGSSRKL